MDVETVDEKGAAVLRKGSLVSVNDSPDPDEPTEEEKQTLRKVSDKLPWSAFLVALIELCERFTYYGLTGPFQNYIQNPPSGGATGVRGAIGGGQKEATGLVNFFTFWCYVTPVAGAIIADQYLGKYKTILCSSVVYIAGLLILFLTSLPTAINHGAALGGLVASMVVLGIGTGGIKSNVSPLIAEQMLHTKPFVKTLKSGERVIVDPAVTAQRVYMMFYLSINIGSLSPIATTEMEKHIGFWSAYLLPFCMFIVGFVIIILGRNQYRTAPPTGSIIPTAFKAMWIGVKNKGQMNAAKPSVRAQQGMSGTVPWNDQFIEELKRALVACRVFLLYPIWWVTYTQMLNNFISQAGEMNLHGIPNDLMQNIDPITIIIFIPIMDRLLYPALRKAGIPFRPITRITFGFFFGAAAMAYAAGVQKLIYKAGPCYDAPLVCDAANLPDGTVLPNNVHVAVQTPAYALIGLSEIFASITGLEYAYTKAPVSMKSFVMSMYLLTTAFGNALAEAIVPVAIDPKLLWMYTGLAVASFVAGCIFWVLFRKYNATEESMNEIDVNTRDFNRKNQARGDEA